MTGATGQKKKGGTHKVTKTGGHVNKKGKKGKGSSSDLLAEEEGAEPRDPDEHPW